MGTTSRLGPRLVIQIATSETRLRRARLVVEARCLGKRKIRRLISRTTRLSSRASQQEAISSLARVVQEVACLDRITRPADLEAQVYSPTPLLPHHRPTKLRRPASHQQAIHQQPAASSAATLAANPHPHCSAHPSKTRTRLQPAPVAERSSATTAAASNQKRPRTPRPRIVNQLTSLHKLRVCLAKLARSPSHLRQPAQHRKTIQLSPLPLPVAVAVSSAMPIPHRPAATPVHFSDRQHPRPLRSLAHFSADHGRRRLRLAICSLKPRLLHRRLPALAVCLAEARILPLRLLALAVCLVEARLPPLQLPVPAICSAMPQRLRPHLKALLRALRRAPQANLPRPAAWRPHPLLAVVLAPQAA